MSYIYINNKYSCKNLFESTYSFKSIDLKLQQNVTIISQIIYYFAFCN